jgi:hypothetical protein
VLAEARSIGFAIRAEADRLIIRGPRRHEAVARKLLAQKPHVLALLAEEDAELTWRVAAMHPQVRASGPIPVLVARQVAPASGRCLSCGDPLPNEQAVRCAFCVRAAQLVLSEVREGVEP